ncbi:MAG: hypothetical protein QOF62_1365 [Pyrinomonadaceae bacterium]|nr:hypothetical protein [Pyrinomonadaceae bacterium]
MRLHLESILPMFWIATNVNAGNNRYRVVSYPEEHCERKAI